METHFIIGAGIAAVAAITALLLRFQNDTIAEEISDAMQFESEKSRAAKKNRS